MKQVHMHNPKVMFVPLPGCAFLRHPYTCRMQWESQGPDNMEKIKEAAVDGTCEGKDVYGYQVKDPEGFYVFLHIGTGGQWILNACDHCAPWTTVKKL